MKADILPKSMQAMLERHIAGKDFIVVKQVSETDFVVAYETPDGSFYRAALGLQPNGSEFCYIQELDENSSRLGAH